MTRRKIVHRFLSGSLLYLSIHYMLGLWPAGAEALGTWWHMGLTLLASFGIAIGVVWSFVVWILWD